MNLPDAEVHRVISSLYNSLTPEPVYEIFINTLISAMLDFDERTFDKSFSNLLIRFGVYGTMINIVYPFLRKTGVLWATDNAMPAQEHFASNIIRRKLLSAVDGIPYPASTKKKFILCLPPDELHEIGLLFSDYLIRAAGYETVYLGANTPFSSLQHTISICNADCLLTFYHGGQEHATYHEQFAILANNNPKTKIVLCTNIVYTGSNTYSNMIYLDEPNKLFDIL
jgi:methanogenic corrinoid protein MtbC1